MGAKGDHPTPWLGWLIFFLSLALVLGFLAGLGYLIGWLVGVLVVS